MSELNENIVGKRDIILFIIVISLAFLGLLILYPASSLFSLKQYGDQAYIFIRQAKSFFVGVVIFLIAAVIPLEIIKKVALPGLVVSFFFLVMVFIPGIGHSVSSKDHLNFYRWIGIGPFSFQPSEMAKPAIIIYLAHILSRNNAVDKEINLKNIIIPFSLIAFVLIAIVLEPQFGTSVCILLVIATLIYIAGFPVLRLLFIALAMAPLLWFLIYLIPYRFSRIRVWLDPYTYRHEGGYQLVMAYRAFREGGIFGDNLGGGFAHRFLTYGHTDFILALCGEDFGIIGVVILIALYVAFLWRTTLILKKISLSFPFLLGSGALLMLIFQTLLNMSVVTGLVPTTGLSLPFISYGGSALTMAFALCGLIVNVSRYMDKKQ